LIFSLCQNTKDLKLLEIYDIDHLRIECILSKFHWGMKALTEVHFQ
jgi:hypothetical protein